MVPTFASAEVDAALGLFEFFVGKFGEIEFLFHSFLLNIVPVTRELWIYYREEEHFLQDDGGERM